LIVKEIDYIETTYILETTKKVKRKNNTCILHDKNMDSWILYITSKSDLLDISKHIVKNIYNPNEWSDIFSFNKLLITPLPALKQMGYPVGRILQQHNLQDIIDQVRINQENENFLPNIKSPIENSSIFSQSQSQSQSHLQTNIGTPNLKSLTNRKP